MQNRSQIEGMISHAQIHLSAAHQPIIRIRDSPWAEEVICRHSNAGLGRQVEHRTTILHDVTEWNPASLSAQQKVKRA
jgi:hypothetical protein